MLHFVMAVQSSPQYFALSQFPKITLHELILYVFSSSNTDVLLRT